MNNTESLLSQSSYSPPADSRESSFDEQPSGSQFQDEVKYALSQITDMVGTVVKRVELLEGEIK